MNKDEKNSRDIAGNTPPKTFTVLGGVNVDAAECIDKGSDTPELVGDAHPATSNSCPQRYGSPHVQSKHYGPEVLPILKVIDTEAKSEAIMKKVTRKTRGWLTGKFSMLHQGHINLIHQAATRCDELVVVLSHSDHRFKDPRLSYRNKMLWLRETFRDEAHIHIVGVDESNIPAYPNGWGEWAALVTAAIGKEFDYIFTSEPTDAPQYSQYFPEQTVVLIDPDRALVPVSATMIRDDMTKYWSYMPSIVRKDFVARVCLVGTESVGKSTLTKMLAKHFQTSWVEEYGRTFCEQVLCMDESLLQFDDYALIAARRYDQELTAARSANRVLFADTAALSTNYFCHLYEGREHPVVTAYQELENYDLFLYLDDSVEFVEDGLRKNRDREYTRRVFEGMFMAYAKKKNAEVVRITGNYNDRLNQAIAAVNALLAKPFNLE